MKLSSRCFPPPRPRFHRAELLIRDNVASGPVHAQPAAQSLALRFASVVIKTEQMGGGLSGGSEGGHAILL